MLALTQAPDKDGRKNPSCVGGRWLGYKRAQARPECCRQACVPDSSSILRYTSPSNSYGNHHEAPACASPNGVEVCFPSFLTYRANHSNTLWQHRFRRSLSSSYNHRLLHLLRYHHHRSVNHNPRAELHFHGHPDMVGHKRMRD